MYVTIWQDYGFSGHTTNVTTYKTYTDETRLTYKLTQTGPHTERTAH